MRHPETLADDQSLLRAARTYAEAYAYEVAARRFVDRVADLVNGEVAASGTLRGLGNGVVHLLGAYIDMEAACAAVLAHGMIEPQELMELSSDGRQP